MNSVCRKLILKYIHCIIYRIDLDFNIFYSPDIGSKNPTFCFKYCLKLTVK